jgi:hypothetical protein
MSSRASQRFAENCRDIERLLQIHHDITGDAAGRRFGVDVLSKSAMVYICNCWAAYLESLVEEALDAIAGKAADFNRLPGDLRQQVARSIKANPNQLAPWDLAGDGWKSYVKNLLKQKQSGTGHAPKSRTIRDLFDQALGIPDITASWQWAWLSAPKAAKKLDDYVSLTSAIPHRTSGLEAMEKWDAKGFLDHVRELVRLTDDAVNNHVFSICGSSLE